MFLAGVAGAEPEHNQLGAWSGIGKLPVGGQRDLAISLGLDIDHPAFGGWNVFGSYEWLWLQRDDQMGAPHGEGQRIQLGVRHALVDKRAGDGVVRLFVDGEAGGGLALLTDTVTGMRAMPEAFAGVRLGYDIDAHTERSPSRTWDAALLLRVIWVRDGAGAMLGVRLAWGD
jgi:hypothetical protein